MADFCFRRSYRGKLKAAILDWAGTAVDYGSLAPAGVFVEVFGREGVEITDRQAREPMGMYKLDHIRVITQMPAVRDRWIEQHGAAPGEEDVRRMFDAFIPLQMECLAKYAAPVPGCPETVAALRQRGMKIGSSTGYNSDMMEILTAESAKQGYEADAVVCATDVPAGRPAPWMCMENARRLNAYPVEAVVKVDDTIPGIEAGLNCGMWTIAVAKTGNEIGLSHADVTAMPADELARRLDAAYRRLGQAGAHYVIDGIDDILPCLDDIECRLAAGEKP
jgi:phosphonoacetaldehyde hydrolase